VAYDRSEPPQLLASWKQVGRTIADLDQYAVSADRLLHVGVIEEGGKALKRYTPLAAAAQSVSGQLHRFGLISTARIMDKNGIAWPPKLVAESHDIWRK
jgi:hypothetical protein